jgi:hypothetical protein
LLVFDGVSLKKEARVNLDTGTIVVVAVILIFYLRLMVIQWGKAKRNRASAARNMSKQNKANSKKVKHSQDDYQKLAFRTNPSLIIIGALIFILGIFSRATNWLPDFLETAWWVSTSIGIIIFGLGFK